MLGTDTCLDTGTTMLAWSEAKYRNNTWRHAIVHVYIEIYLFIYYSCGKITVIYHILVGHLQGSNTAVITTEVHNLYWSSSTFIQSCVFLCVIYSCWWQCSKHEDSSHTKMRDVCQESRYSLIKNLSLENCLYDRKQWLSKHPRAHLCPDSTVIE